MPLSVKVVLTPRPRYPSAPRDTGLWYRRSKALCALEKSTSMRSRLSRHAQAVTTIYRKGTTRFADLTRIDRRSRDVTLMMIPSLVVGILLSDVRKRIPPNGPTTTVCHGTCHFPIIHIVAKLLVKLSVGLGIS